MATTNSLNISEAGYVVFDGTSNFSGRTFQAGAGITLTNPSGVAGNTTITANGANDLHTSQYIVSAQGTVATGANFTTITAAIASAVGTGIKQTIFIQPGTYTEDVVLPDGYNLAAYTCGSNGTVDLVGKLTIQGSAVFSTKSTISGLRITSNGSSCIEATGTNTCQAFFTDCYIFATGNVTAINLTCSGNFSSFVFQGCQGELAGASTKMFNSTMSGTSAILRFIGCSFTNNNSGSGQSTAAGTVSNGFLGLNDCSYPFPITTSGSAQLVADFVDFSALLSVNQTTNFTYLTIGSSTECLATNIFINSGTASAISVSAGSILTMTGSRISSSNANAITGAGEIRYGTSSFSNTSSLINTTTQTPFVSTNDAVKVTTPGAYPYTTVPQDGFIKVDTSAARTIVPLASPTIGQRHIIKDTVGSAAANNITITPSGKNIDGVASLVLTTNYACVTIIYNGSEWSIC